VAHEPGSSERTLFASDPRKDEHRIWQCRTDGESTDLLLRVEHHGAAPGWHVHNPAEGRSAYTGERHPVSGEQVPAIAAAGLWRCADAEERIPLFPAERMTGETVAHLTDMLAKPTEDITLRPVPHGLAIGLPGRTLMGDSMALYLSQLGSGTPVFRLEDDGVTIPALQAAGALAAADYMLPHDILGAHTRGRTHFSPDMRILYTPYFPADELADRVAEFAQTLSTFAAILNAHEGGPGSAARRTAPPTGGKSGKDSPSASEAQNNPIRPHGNAWTRAASYVTV